MEKPRPKRLRRLLITLGIVVITLILAVVIWQHWPTGIPEARVIVRIPNDPLVAAGTDGFLTARRKKPSDVKGLLIFHSWDGREVWKVAASMDDASPWTYRLKYVEQPPLCSPSGHAVAAAEKFASGAYLYTWLDGRPLGRAWLPIGQLQNRLQYIITEQGEVIAWLYGLQATPVWLIRGNTILAKGTHLSGLRVDPMYYRQVTEDGKVLIGISRSSPLEYEYVSIIRTGNRLRFTFNSTAAYQLNFGKPYLLDHGSMVLTDGRCFEAKGGSHESSSTAKAGIEEPAILQPFLYSSRLLGLYSGRTWNIPAPLAQTTPTDRRGTVLMTDATPLYRYYRGKFPSRVLNAPLLGDGIQYLLHYKYRSSAYAFYTRSGRLLARITLAEGRDRPLVRGTYWGGLYGPANDRYTLDDPWQVALAPDGKHVVMAAHSRTRKRPETLIFALPR